MHFRKVGTFGGAGSGTAAGNREAAGRRLPGRDAALPATEAAPARLPGRPGVPGLGSSLRMGRLDGGRGIIFHVELLRSNQEASETRRCMEPEANNSRGDDEDHATESESLLLQSCSERTCSSFVFTAHCAHNDMSGILD